MILFPAIDLLDGQCVRLYQGDYAKASTVAGDALETARRFREAGATHLHVVDLNGAREGCPSAQNRKILERISAELDLHIELGGGIRTLDAIREALSSGVREVILGSAATDPDFLASALSSFPGRIVVGIDARDGYVATAGWTDLTGIHYLDFANTVAGAGVRRVIFTDISRDGTLNGPNLDMLAQLQSVRKLQITASGGIRTLADIEQLSAMGLYGAICGKSLYAGTLDLRAAIQAVKESCDAG